LATVVAQEDEEDLEKCEEQLEPMAPARVAKLIDPNPADQWAVAHQFGIVDCFDRKLGLYGFHHLEVNNNNETATKCRRQRGIAVEGAVSRDAVELLAQTGTPREDYLRIKISKLEERLDSASSCVGVLTTRLRRNCAHLLQEVGSKVRAQTTRRPGHHEAVVKMPVDLQQELGTVFGTLFGTLWVSTERTTFPRRTSTCCSEKC
jgi:hypothetical protein